MIMVFYSSVRICGHQLLNTKDDGTKLIPVAAEDSGMYNQRPQTSVLEDVEEFGAFDSQGYVPISTGENTTLLFQIYCIPIQTQKWEFHCLRKDMYSNLCYSLVIAVIKTGNHQSNWNEVMWLFASDALFYQFIPHMFVFFLAYSLRDFILIPYQNLLDLIWVVRTIVYQTRRSLFY